MKKIKLRMPVISRWTALLVMFAFVIPAITALAMSGATEESTAVYQQHGEEDSPGHSYMEVKDGVQDTFPALDEDEIKPLQASPDAEESMDDALDIISQADEVLPEIENKADSQNTVEDDGQKILMEAPERVLNGQLIGKVSVPAVGLSDNLAIGASVNEAQKVLETSAAIMCYESMGLPEKAPISVVGGHNYMEFNKLKDAKVGNDVILNLDWGVYKYTIYDIKIQTALSSAPRGYLVVYTCYPFDQRLNTVENAYFLCKPKITEVE